MPRSGYPFLSAALCLLGATVALRVAQWRFYGFDILSETAWDELWRGFVADEIVFETPAQAGFLIAFPLAAIAALMGVGPVSATLTHVAARLGTKPVRRPAPPAAELGKFGAVPSIDEPLSQAQETADLLYDRLFRAPAGSVQTRSDQGLERG